MMKNFSGRRNQLQAIEWFKQNILKRNFNLEEIEIKTIPPSWFNSDCGGYARYYCVRRMLFFFLLASPVWMKTTSYLYLLIAIFCNACSM